MTLSSDPCASRSRSSSIRSSRRRWAAGRRRRRWRPPCPRPAGWDSSPRATAAPDAVREEIGELRRLTERPFGINLFAPGPALADSSRPRRLCLDARRRGGALRRRVGRAAFMTTTAGTRSSRSLRTSGIAGRVGDLRLPVRGPRSRRCTPPDAPLWVTVTTAAEARQRRGGGRRRARGAGRGGRRAIAAPSTSGRPATWACSRCSSSWAP